MSPTPLLTEHDFSSFLVFAVPALIIIAILLVAMLIPASERPPKPPSREDELEAQIKELKRRHVIDRG